MGAGSHHASLPPSDNAEVDPLDGEHRATTIIMQLRILPTNRSKLELRPEVLLSWHMQRRRSCFHSKLPVIARRELHPTAWSLPLKTDC